MLTSAKLASALMAAAAVLNAEDGEAVTHARPVAQSQIEIDGDKVADFLRNDQSGFQRRSASAIASATGLTEGAVIAAAQSHEDLEGKPSSGKLGYLVWIS